MKERYHHVIHDTLASVLMIIVLSLSLFIVLNVVKLQNEQKMGEHQQEAEQYRSQIMYQCICEEELPSVRLQVKDLKVETGNVILKDFYYQVGDGNYYAPLAIVIQQNEPLVEELQKGRYPTETEISHGRRCVVIGSGLLRQVKKNGKEQVLSIDGIEYDVIGILKDVTGNKMDDRVIVFYDSLSKRTRNKMEKKLAESLYLDVLYGSNQGTLEEMQTLVNWLYRIAGEKYVSQAEGQSEEMNYAYEAAYMMREYNRYTLYVMFGFCMCACFIVSSVWAKRRRREMVVRKALGSTFFGVIGVLLKDLVIMIGISMAVDAVLLALQMVVSGDNWVHQVYFTENIRYIMAGIGIMVVTAMIQPLFVVAAISPAQGTRSL